MAKSRKKKRSRRKPRSRSGGGGGRASQHKSGTQALKGIGIGMGLMVLAAAFSFVKFDGQTLFNRVAMALESSEDAPKEGKPELARDYDTAAPLEKLTASEQDGLDSVIKKKTGK